MHTPSTVEHTFTWPQVRGYYLSEQLSAGHVTDFRKAEPTGHVLGLYVGILVKYADRKY